MSTPTETIPTKPPNGSEDEIVIADVTCVACGCLCDDITVRVRGGRLVETRNACEIGRAWFLKARNAGGAIAAIVEGKPVSLEQALDRAVEVLAAAHAPVVLGLTRTTLEAQREAVALADRLGAFVGLGHSATAAPEIQAVARAGSVSATLGEVKNRADVVVFWHADPIVTHPRHWEHYSVAPAGRFVPEGRRGRTVLVADSQHTATAERADHFLKISEAAQSETLWAIRALIQGIHLDPAHVERSTGVAFEDLRAWADRLPRARYGAFFHGDNLARNGAAAIEAALALVRDLNSTTRFVALSLGGPWNPKGAEAVLTWQTGYPLSVDLGPGIPRSDLRETSSTRLENGEADAALIIGDEGDEHLTHSARDFLARIPTVVIGPEATASGRLASVAMASAAFGIETAGTVLRCDGIMLPLRPVRPATLPTDRDLLHALATRLAAHERRS
jgi:formylmethanofuran dehydrogenase subunit B